MYSPLHLAAKSNNCEVIELLVKAGADIDAVNAKVLPYNGKLAQQKAFPNFMFCWPFANFFLVELFIYHTFLWYPV